MQREKLGSTGVGNGIAIPHGKLPKLENLFGLFARLDRPIDFEALDGQPVDLDLPAARAGRRGRRPPQGAGADRAPAARARVAKLARSARRRRALRRAHGGAHRAGGVTCSASSCAGLTRASINFRKRTDGRVKPGHDEGWVFSGLTAHSRGSGNQVPGTGPANLLDASFRGHPEE